MHHTTALIARRQRLGLSSQQEVGRVSQPLLRRLALGLLLLAGTALVIWTLVHFASGSTAGPKRQVARIALLPDTPPPPPPPPKEQKKEEPKPQPRPQAQPEQAPKPPQPANEPIKMEGAAGNGPSAFAAGAVNNEYRAGPTSSGGASSPGVADRAAERLYANTVRQLLLAEMERRLAPEAGELSANFALWINPDGHIARWEADGGTPALKTALDASAEALRLPVPPAVAQPMRFRLTVRAGA